MSRIVEAVNKMVANGSAITNVMPGEDETEYFFVYQGKYKWSIADRLDGVHLWFYPGTQPLEHLAALEGEEWETVAMVHYSDQELGTQEAKASFRELVGIIKEKRYGMDDVLADIISGGDE